MVIFITCLVRLFGFGDFICLWCMYLTTVYKCNWLRTVLKIFSWHLNGLSNTMRLPGFILDKQWMIIVYPLSLLFWPLQCLSFCDLRLLVALFGIFTRFFKKCFIYIVTVKIVWEEQLGDIFETVWWNPCHSEVSEYLNVWGEIALGLLSEINNRYSTYYTTCNMMVYLS